MTTPKEFEDMCRAAAQAMCNQDGKRHLKEQFRGERGACATHRRLAVVAVQAVLLCQMDSAGGSPEKLGKAGE